MMVTEVWIIARLIKLKSYFRRVVREIYVHRDGETIEVVYDN